VSLNHAGKATTDADMSVSEVASATGLSQTLIYREINAGNLVAYKVGKVLRIEREAYADWKQRCKVRPRAESPMYEIGRAVQKAGGASAAFTARLAAIEAGFGEAA
jgi:excisionase family DNA binding protein